MKNFLFASAALCMITIFLLSGCVGETPTGGNGAGGGANTKPTIKQLDERSFSFDYTCDVDSVLCSNQKCYPVQGRYITGNSIKKRLAISYSSTTENYTSYSLTDFNELVTYQWSPDYEILGSPVQCSGFSVADNPPNKTLEELGAEIIGRETCSVDGQSVACTRIKYNVYTSPAKEGISYVVEHWIWDDYGVVLKAINYKYETYDKTKIDTDWSFNMTTSNFNFGPIGDGQFAVPDPCPITEQQ